MPSGVQLCHVVVFVRPGAPEAARLAAAGMQESFRRRHPGQGTANVCYCFDNAYLELLWVDDWAEAQASPLGRARLAERARWRTTGACPFGLAVRLEDAATPLPFPAWDYRPPYLPAGMAIPVALSSADIRQPLLFRSPGHAPPVAWTDGRAGARQEAAGLTEIGGLHLAFRAGEAPGADLERLAALGFLTLGETAAGSARMVLTLSREDGGAARQLSLPDFTWIDAGMPT